MRQESIKYLRHPHGRGKLYDDSDVSLSSYLSADSIAAENCVLRGADVRDGSRIAGEALLLGGTIRTSFVGGKAVIANSPFITRSVIIGGRVSGDAVLTDVILKDDAEVYDRPTILGASLGEAVVIEGSARVYGTAFLSGAMRLHGRMRLNAGVWSRAPKFVELGFEAVTESDLGAMVGCRDRTRSYWLKHGPAFGKRMGLSPKQIQQLIDAVLEVTGDS